jgi:hypothetical protein
LWLIARKGHWTRRYILFSNRPPPWNEPELPAPIAAALEKRLARKRAEAAAEAAARLRLRPALAGPEG